MTLLEIDSATDEELLTELKRITGALVSRAQNRSVVLAGFLKSLDPITDVATEKAGGGLSDQRPPEIDIPVKRRTAPRSANGAARPPRAEPAKRARRVHTEEDKRRAVALARDLGITAAAKECDVVPSLLRGWIAVYGETPDDLEQRRRTAAVEATRN